MRITLKFLKNKEACQDGIDWVVENKLIGLKDSEMIKDLMKADKLDWANWLIVRCMNYKQYVSYAVYAAESVLDIYEKKYPNDKRPREAIEAAKLCIKNPSKKNKVAASAAYSASAYSAYSAAYSASSASSAAFSASSSASSAAFSASSAAYSAAYSAAFSAAYSASSTAASAAKKDLQIKILKNGLTLLTKFK